MRFRVGVVIGGAALLFLLGLQNAGATTDPLWSKQYGPLQIGAPTAWQKSTGKGVTVAIVDSGIDVEHPDLRGHLDTVNDHDFGCNDDNPDDDSTERDGEGKLVKGHGTHVSGTIGAVANNGIGVAGVAPDVKLMGLKVFPSTSSCGTLLSIVSSTPQAINWAVDHGAKVINLSLSEFNIAGLAGSIETPCNNAFNRGTLCVVAAGNSGETKSSGYPYDFNGIIVTANDSTGAHATFGQKADTKWSVSAPGVDVLNTWPIDDPAHNGYNAIQGTSMASPHVAGAAAVLFGAGMNVRQVAEALTNTAGPARDSAVEGAGIIHMDRALGLETTSTSIGQKSGTGDGVVTRGGRSGAGGGSGAAPVTTPTSTPLPGSPGGVQFEEGLTTGDASKDFDAIRLNEASKNSANKPFNVTGPLIGLSILSGIVLVAVAIPRLRSKDAPPLT
jgi:subtilisin family serine protease